LILPPAVATRWQLTDPVPIANTATSRVWRVRRGASTAIVKELKPIGVDDELRGAEYLAWLDGRGAVRLLDRYGTALLLEDAGSEPLAALLEREGDEVATEVLLEVIAALHAPDRTKPPPPLEPLETWFASLLAQPGRESRIEAETLELVADGASVARELLADQRDVRPLHGDIHHENIHRAERGWLAIDPKGLVGDAAYDVANVFCNPLRRDDLHTDPARIRHIGRAFADRFDRDPRDVLRWAFAYACLSASWELDAGHAGDANRTFRVAAAIRATL
jgi:streptomycin 6-kinase